MLGAGLESVHALMPEGQVSLLLFLGDPQPFQRPPSWAPTHMFGGPGVLHHMCPQLTWISEPDTALAQSLWHLEHISSNSARWRDQRVGVHC